MMVDARRRRWTVAVLAAVTAMLSGCASSSRTHGTGMMGGDAPYHFSRLSCAAPGSLPGVTVSVTLADMGMTRTMSGSAPVGAHMMLRATPAGVPAGTVSLVASNLGWRTHELVILPLGPGAGPTAGAGHRPPGPDGRVGEAGSVGEASSGCAAGTGDGIASGQVGWMTVTLAPGRYELVCNEPNHYAGGMYQELLVT